MHSSPPPRSVLWIDDDAAGLDLGARLLQSEGVNVDVATTGRSGLAMASAFPYSLILLDLNLPDASGLDVLKGIVSRGVKAPVVLVTGYATLPVAVDAVKQGAVDVRSKPFLADEAIVLLDLYAKEPEPSQPGEGIGRREETPTASIQTLSELAVASPRLSLSRIARRVGLGRHAVETLIREQTGMCWRDWRRRLVMRNAAHVVASTDVPFKTLAEQFGYSAIQSFSKAFRDVWGVSPGRYRRDVSISPSGQAAPDSDPPARS